MKLIAAVMVLFCFCLSTAAGAPTDLRFVGRGQWLKVQLRTQPDGRMTARRVDFAASKETVEIEGPVRDVNRRGNTFAVGPWTFRVSAKTRFENAQREPRSFSDLAKRHRVKAKVRGLDGKHLKVRSVRIYEDSKDTDIEVIAPVQAVDHKRAEFSLASARVRVNDRTRYLNVTAAALPQAPEDAEVFRRIRRDDDEQHPDPIRIGRVFIGGRFGAEYKHSHDLDLDEALPDSDHWANPGGQIELSAPLGEFSEAYAKLNYYRPMYAGNRPGASGSGDFNVKEAFVYIGNFLHRSLGLQVGRQRFRDRREWLYDDELDAVRLHLAKTNIKVELTAAKGLIGPTGSRSDQYYFIGHSQYRLPGRKYVGVYFVKRNDLTARDEDPIWYGLNSRGRLVRNAEYWVELARMKGRKAQNVLRGYGYDAGGSYRIPTRWQPTLSAGYAFGSGDANLNDGVDGNFRQTALHDNSARFGGLRRYRYYGVVLDPELYNLKTAIYDFGVRPSNDISVNVNFHTYRQAVTAKRPGDMKLTLRPGGRDPRLGKEFDLIVAVRKIRNVDLTFTGGVFLPGPAYRGVRDVRAFLLRPEVRYYF